MCLISEWQIFFNQIVSEELKHLKASLWEKVWKDIKDREFRRSGMYCSRSIYWILVRLAMLCQEWVQINFKGLSIFHDIMRPFHKVTAFITCYPFLDSEPIVGSVGTLDFQLWSILTLAVCNKCQAPCTIWFLTINY